MTGCLVCVQVLDLSENGFGGNLSAELFSNCQQLRCFNASNNTLTGKLPNELWGCMKLKELVLSHNNFTGDLPFGTGRQPPVLEKLLLDQNQFTGRLVDVFDSIGCSHLNFIDLSNNKLNGTIPKQLGSCSNLTIVNFQRNNLTGTIPSELGELKDLQCLGLGTNNLTGTIPESLTQCSLYLLDISRNKLSGLIPTWLANITALKYFVGHSNNFTGGVPVEVSHMQSLLQFDVGNNSLSGEIPPELGHLTSVRMLRLARNQLTGKLPPELGNMTALQALDVSWNRLTGGIPPEFGKLADLLWLQLAQNYFTGPMPPQLTNCTSLLWLNLCNNRFSGEIPSNLFALGLRANETFAKNQRLIGGPPMDVGECSIARSWIPAEMTVFNSLMKSVHREACRASWQRVLQGQDLALGYWQLSSNNFSGPLPQPSEASKLKVLLLSGNLFSGPIPSNIGSTPFISINVSRNQLDGSIPDTIGKLGSTLQSLDLSYNNLSGELPAAALENLTFLSSFNVSCNVQLRGPVPNKYQFASISESVYNGDLLLCRTLDPYHIVNATSIQLCPPAPQPVLYPESMFHKHLLLASALICISATATVALSTLLTMWLASKWKKPQFAKNQVFVGIDSGSEDENGKAGCHIPLTNFGLPFSKAITYTDLMVATNNFSAANIIGDGGFGIVYKAELGDGVVVAIKKLIQDGAQGHREFLAEMQTLGHIQHKNLVPLLGYCCGLRERLLVYKCLSNGSLDDWLYESDKRAASLDWPTRLRIALGTARGLRFLHHDNVPHIIHRDMKASNILLNEDFDACLTDFGLARVIDLQSTHVSTVVAGTPGYVPPEYSQTWKATVKGDVYSFGVVMLELATGRRPVGPEFHGLEAGNLVEWVNKLWWQNRHQEACHPVVLQSSDPEKLARFVSLALCCTSEKASTRPTMLQVTSTLEELTASTTEP